MYYNGLIAVGFSQRVTWHSRQWALAQYKKTGKTKTPATFIQGKTKKIPGSQGLANLLASLD
jgi:hypothetical protein